ncbi:MAG: HAMP domain-containing histidine kinase [Oscillospiraceae bacterium]|nr:HAMP domain-containing histidine kinase [Oscillospiraceae bacterium]
MKQSGYRTVFHIYLIFVLSLVATSLLGGCFFLQTVFIQSPGGANVRSDWPKTFTENFQQQIIFIDGAPQIRQAGMSVLQENTIGIQILDTSGREVFSYQKPEQARTAYSSAELLRLVQSGQSEGSGTAVFGTVSSSGSEYVYILYFSMTVSQVTMYVNGERFAGGKAIILPILLVLFLIILVLGVLYGLFTSRAIKRLTTAIHEISNRSYLPVQDQGVFHDLYGSLNTLDADIRASDQLRTQTEKMREEWIANITHDLKTPLSPIKGYAEILLEDSGTGPEQVHRYAGITLKNVSYMETLVDDLKLTYQLENGMLPINREEQNIVRFLKELVIDILNAPEYEKRTIHFESAEDSFLWPFDQTLITRAFRNLIINAFVHGEDDTEVTLCVSTSDSTLKIDLSDNGKGMEPETVEHLFDRYYRGINTVQRPEGSGLGLAIAKSIIELHGGTISVSSISTIGTAFQIEFFRC